MEIDFSSGEVTVSETLAENFLWLFQSQVKIYIMRKVENGVTMQQDWTQGGQRPVCILSLCVC